MLRLFVSVFLLWLVYSVSTTVVTWDLKKSVNPFKPVDINYEFKQLECLTENIYYESTGEPLQGMIGVGQVTLQRAAAKHTSICNTVYKPSWFSWTNDKPKRLAYMTSVNVRAMEQARTVAKLVYWQHETVPCLKGATHYHADWIQAPKWADKNKFACKVGKHLYYSGIAY